MFSVTAGTCPSLAPTLAPNASCTVSVIFSPASTGTKQATLQITSNDPNKPTSNTVLTGTGYANDFSITSGDISVVKGESKNISLTLTAYNFFNSPVTLSHAFTGIQPTGITPSLSPYTLTPSTEGVQTTLTISASPETAPGTYTLRITGTGGGITKTKDVTVTIASEMGLPAVSIADGVKGTSYSSAISISGGVAPYTVSVLSGALPDGLVLSSSGSLSGTPTTRGTYTFTIKVEDAQGHTTQKDYQIRIYDTSYRQLSLEASSWTVEKNTLTGWITIKVLDDYNHPANTTANTMVHIESSSLTGRFTTDGMNFSFDNSASPTIPSGQSSIVFKYKDSTAGAFTLTASGMEGTPSQGWTSGTHSITVTSPTLKNAVLTTSVTSGATYGQGVTVTGTLKDASTNTALNGKNISIVFTAPYGTKTSPVSVTTNSSGSYSYIADVSVIDTAGAWSVEATFNDTEPAAYNSAAINTSFSIAKADTRIIISLNSGSITPTGSLVVTGQLVSHTFVPVDLSSIQINLSFTQPNGTVHNKTVNTYDQYGHFIYTYSGEFNEDGLWSVSAGLISNPNLNGSQSESASLSVATSAGYAILIEGESGTASRPYYTASLDDVYAKLKKRSFTDENIYYLSYEGTSHVNVDALTTKANIQNAITNWAYERIISGGIAPLYIIMVNHGDPGRFYIDPSTITPSELNTWLTTLENNIQTAIGKPLTTIIVNGSCFSGSFIPALSKHNRVIITSATGEEKSAQGPQTFDTTYGEYFIYYLFSYLTKGDTLRDAFRDAAKVTHQYFKESGANCGTNSLCKEDKSRQHPLLDDNGDGKGSWMNIVGQEDGDITSKLVLGLGANPVSLAWQEIMPTATTTGSSIIAWAKTSNPSKTAASWVEIKKPSFTSTDSLSGQVALNLPKAAGTYKSSQARWEYNLTGLDEIGAYTLFYYAVNNDDGDLIPPAIGTVYVDTSANNPPQVFTTISPTMNQSVDDAMMIFQWNPSVDPDGDTVTYTLKLYEDSNGSKGTEIKRYELIPQEAYAINALQEKRNDGTTTLFTTGSSYWFDVEAIDSKGKSITSTPVKFRVTFTNALSGIITGIIMSDIDFSKITGASLSVNSGSALSLSGGSYIISAPSGEINLTISATGYETKTATVSVSTGQMITSNLTLTPTTNTHTLSLSLSTGWNFISFPKLPACGLPSDPSCNAVINIFGDVSSNVRIIWGYDNINKAWKKYKPGVSGNTLTTIEGGKGYWVYMDASGSIVLKDASTNTEWTAQSTTVPLAEGWNLIAYNGTDDTDVVNALDSISGKWSIVWHWKDNQWYAKHATETLMIPVLDKFKKGKAYWIKIKTGQATDWTQP